MGKKLAKNMAKLTINGLNMHNTFPVKYYENIHEIIVLLYRNNEFYEHYSGSWNALAYRYQAVIYHGEEFIKSLKMYGATPNPLNRSIQERLLFDFYSSSFSSFEAMFYGLYSIGHFISPEHFPISSPKDQQNISIITTRKSYLKAFPDDQILKSFDKIIYDSQYIKIKEIRNVLSHRTAPGRRTFLGLGIKDSPTTEWKLNNIPLDENLISECVTSLSGHIGSMLHDMVIFIKRNA